jgi:Pyridine nucleotide-disulphide oxidoreductase
VNIAMLRNDCEVAVIGAGPYGLSVAAHLKAADITVRVFGAAMSSWRDHMPDGMRLQSSWSASHIADPSRRFSLDAFAHQHGLEPAQEQQPRAQFLRYGEWFQRQTVPDLDCRRVLRVEDLGKSFCLALEDGEAVHARRVVVAVGLAGQEYRPKEFDGLPSALVSHSSEHTGLDAWRGQRVAVVGRGQSACESAALLKEAGSDVEIICRGDIKWQQAQRAGGHGDWHRRLARLSHVTSDVGPSPLNLLNDLPGVEHRMPDGARSWINARSLRPAAAWWVKPRLDGVRVHGGCRIVKAVTMGNQVGVQLDSGLRVYRHVFLATGYKVDLAKLRILPHELRRRISCVDGSPVLGKGFESTARGLHFVGASAVASYGPLMRFVAGTGYAARSVTRTHLTQSAQARFDTRNLMECDFLTSR